MLGQTSCSDHRAQNLHKLYEANRQAIKALPNETKQNFEKQLALLEKQGVSVPDSTLFNLTDNVSNEIKRNIQYHQLINYVETVKPLYGAIIKDEKLKFSSLAILDLYRSTVDFNLGLYDRATAGYLQILKDAKSHDLYEIESSAYFELAAVYTVQHQYDDALKANFESLDILKKYLKNDVFSNRELSVAYNNIANDYNGLMNYDKAVEYRMMSLHTLPEKFQKEYHIIQLNLADDYSKMQEYSLAQKHLMPAIAFFEKTQNMNELPIAYHRYAIILWKTNRIDEAKKYYQKAFELTGKGIIYADQLRIIHDYINFCEATGDKDTEMQLLKYRLQLEDKSDIGTTRQTMLSRLYQEDLKKNDTSTKYFKKTINRWKWIAACVGLLLLAVIAGFLLHERQLRRRQRKLSQKRDEMYEQLSKATMELNFANTQLIETREELTSLQQTMMSKSHKEAMTEIQRLTKKMNHVNSMTVADDSLAIANPDFFKKLISKYPKLTKGDLKLCAMLKQGLTNKEIAAITGREERSVEVARNRLRKKMNLPEGEDLVLFMMKF